MTRAQRLIPLGLAAVVAVVAVLLIGTGGDETGRAAATPTPGATATPAAPEPPLRIRVMGRVPAGGVKELEVGKGERVRFTVSSDAADHVHVHGYDLKRDVAPGNDAAFDFEATIDGVFEVELEEAGRPILELRVNP